MEACRMLLLKLLAVWAGTCRDIYNLDEWIHFRTFGQWVYASRARFFTIGSRQKMDELTQILDVWCVPSRVLAIEKVGGSLPGKCAYVEMDGRHVVTRITLSGGATCYSEMPCQNVARAVQETVAQLRKVQREKVNY